MGSTDSERWTCSRIFVLLIFSTLISTFLAGSLHVTLIITRTTEPIDLQVTDSASVQFLNLSQNQVTANWDLGFSLKGDTFNDGGATIFSNISVSAQQNNQRLATSTVDRFTVISNELSIFRANFEPMTVAFGDWTALGRSGDVAAGLVTLDLQIEAQVKYQYLCPKVGQMKAFCKGFETIVSPNATTAAFRLGSSSCQQQYKWQPFSKCSICVKKLVFVVLGSVFGLVISCACYCQLSRKTKPRYPV